MQKRRWEGSPVLTLLCFYPTDNAIEAIDEFAFLEGKFTMPFSNVKYLLL